MTSTQPWSHQLEQISKELMDASINIQSSFQSYAHVTNALAKRDPHNNTMALHTEADPINILSRIALLESTLKKLKIECEEYVKQKPNLAEEVTAALLENFFAIEKLTLLAKGRKATIDPNLKQLAVSCHEQNMAWNHSSNYDYLQSQNEEDSSASIVDASARTSANATIATESEQNPTSSSTTTLRNSASFISISNGNGTIKITIEEFNDIPPLKRGRCSLSHVQTIASFICTETIERYHEGYRGKYLGMTREHCLKYSGGYPGLYGVIKNHTLWRDILNCLQFLAIVRMDPSDGTIFLTGI